MKKASDCSHLTVEQIDSAEIYWLRRSQCDHFGEEIVLLKRNKPLSRSSCLLHLNPFLDSNSLLRVGGREQCTEALSPSQHPIIVHGRHPVVKLLIYSEHRRLLQAGPQLLTSILSQRFHVVGHRRTVRSITRSCVTCRKHSARPKPQLVGKLPMERVTPDSVFERVGVDYAGPIYIKYGYTRKPTIVKAYVCVFVSMTVKAVHLEMVSDLTTECFIACLRCFIARRGLPSLIISDNGTNFVGATRELSKLTQFLNSQKSQGDISDFCSSQSIQWKLIPERAPNFGGLWEAAVKSFKQHFRKIVGETKLTFEEAATVLAQVEACLNSRPLSPMPCDDDGVEALTPGHFLIGRALTLLPYRSYTYLNISLLKRWHLCQALVRHFWKRWHLEYLSSIRKYVRWNIHSRNLQVGDLVTIHEDNLVPGKWPLARMHETHPGRDGVVRMVTVKTLSGYYKRPVTKLALLLPVEN